MVRCKAAARSGRDCPGPDAGRAGLVPRCALRPRSAKAAACTLAAPATATRATGSRTSAKAPASSSTPTATATRARCYKTWLAGTVGVRGRAFALLIGAPFCRLCLRTPQRHGQGVQTYRSGDVYRGQWEHDLRHGQGTFTAASGLVYTGSWRYDKVSGRPVPGCPGCAPDAQCAPLCTMRTPRQRDGKGTCTYPDGSTYEGEWRLDRHEGQGTLTYANGSIYCGAFSVNKVRPRCLVAIGAGSSSLTQAWSAGRPRVAPAAARVRHVHWPGRVPVRGRVGARPPERPRRPQDRGRRLRRPVEGRHGAWLVVHACRGWPPPALMADTVHVVGGACRIATQRHGSGVFTTPFGTVYSGTWHNDQKVRRTFPDLMD